LTRRPSIALSSGVAVANEGFFDINLRVVEPLLGLAAEELERVNYSVEFKPRALKDLKTLRAADQRRILAGAEALQDNLAGDVKKLTNYTPEYRLRIGNYRALFEVEGDTVVIYRVLHRKDAYQ
jgi:mRNA interferase RelE/StbE